MKTLLKEFGFLRIEQAAPNLFSLGVTSANGWRQISPGIGAFVNTTYFDLAGMSQDDKTLFFEGAALQDVRQPIVFNQATGDTITVVDVMSKIPLTDTEYSFLSTYGNLADNTVNSLTFDQTIYLRIRVMTVDVDTTASGTMVTVSDNQLGSLSPTAGDRIYCARYVGVRTPTVADQIDVLGCRYLLRANAKEEAEYQYLMRLKRSYELQNEPDRD